MKYATILLFLFIICPTRSFAWGLEAHKIIAEFSTQLINPSVFKNCSITPKELILHSTDPDTKWKTQPILHPHEPQAHFFHLDRQPRDWRTRKEAQDISQGFLFYKIIQYLSTFHKVRAAKNTDSIKEYLYGLTHYLGDLTQPLHLHHDYDGIEAGLPDIHQQFETKMVNRYKEDIRKDIEKMMKSEKIPPFWQAIDNKTLVRNIAEQTFAKVQILFQKSKFALKENNFKNSRHPHIKKRFVKSILWSQTGQLAEQQIALSARLIAHIFNQICSD